MGEAEGHPLRTLVEPHPKVRLRVTTLLPRHCPLLGANHRGAYQVAGVSAVGVHQPSHLHLEVVLSEDPALVVVLWEEVGLVVVLSAGVALVLSLYSGPEVRVQCPDYVARDVGACHLHHCIFFETRICWIRLHLWVFRVFSCLRHFLSCLLRDLSPWSLWGLVCRRVLLEKNLACHHEVFALPDFLGVSPLLVEALGDHLCLAFHVAKKLPENQEGGASQEGLCATHVVVPHESEVVCLAGVVCDLLCLVRQEGLSVCLAVAVVVLVYLAA